MFESKLKKEELLTGLQVELSPTYKKLSSQFKLFLMTEVWGEEDPDAKGAEVRKEMPEFDALQTAWDEIENMEVSKATQGAVNKARSKFNTAANRFTLKLNAKVIAKRDAAMAAAF